MLAQFVHDYNTWMGMGHTMPAGDPPTPLSEHTKMNGIILLPPILVNPEFLTLQMDEDRLVRFYCIIPLHQEEMEFKLKNGVDALMNKLDKYRINEVIELNRKNVCKSSILQFLKR